MSPIEPHIHEYALTVQILQEGPTHKAFCTHPECDHELDAQGIILGLDASACIDQEQAEELSKLLYADGDASGVPSEYAERYEVATRLERYAASLKPVVKVG